MKVLDKEISARIYDIMDQPNKEEFLTQPFENLKLLNYYFQINSDWARGNKEMLMVSTILDQQIPTEDEEKISILCTEFSEQLQSNEEIYKAFYINDVNNFDKEDQESIRKNEALIKDWVENLYWVIIEDTREKTEEEEIANLLDEKTEASTGHEIETSKEDDDDYGYITTSPSIPPKPPGGAGSAKLKIPAVILEEKAQIEPYCKHCGAELPEGQTICLK